MPTETLETESVPCELCGSCEKLNLFTGRDRLLGLLGEFNVVQCQRCRLVYTDPRPTARSLGAYYPENYGVYAPEGGQAERMSVYHRRIARRLNRLAAPGSAKARRVLDIGCGEGAFLEEMRKLGWQVKGLEMDANAARRARSARSLEVVNATVEEADFDLEAFDLITLSHLLEHVPHPRATLRRARGWLAAGGWLFITLPNVESWERRYFQEDWYPWDLPRHLYHFSDRTLGALLKEEGFRLVDQRFLNGFFAPQSLRYRRQAARGSDPAPPVPERGSSGPVTAAEGAREALKTAAFKGLLTAASITGRFVHGEILEITAVKAS